MEDRVIKSEKIEWRKLEWLQGKLKELSKASFEKLKHSLKTNSFVQPFNVWDENGKLWILDGHHRKRAMEELGKGGEQIPDTLPANFIRCADIKEARKLVLMYASIYAAITEESLYEYVHEAGLDFDELKLAMDLPGIDSGKFETEWMRDDAGKPLDEDLAEGMGLCKCAECGNEHAKNE